MVGVPFARLAPARRPRPRRGADLVWAFNATYRAQPALWEVDFRPEGFAWLVGDARDENVIALRVSHLHLPALRVSTSHPSSGRAGDCRSRPMDTGARFEHRFAVLAGSDVGNGLGIEAEAEPLHGQPCSACDAAAARHRCGPPWNPVVRLVWLGMARDNSIVVEKLVREFKKGPRAVDGIDLYVAPGEIYGFLGPNGAGKSTTVLMLTTLLPPTAGSARVGGYDVRTEGPKVRSVIGAALQEAALDPLLTGRDHMKLQTMLQAIPRPSGRGRTSCSIGSGSPRPPTARSAATRAG